MEIKSFIETNKGRFIEELAGLIRIPSVSAKVEHKADMVACAEHWTTLLLAAGADKAVVMPTKGNPVVYGEKIIDPSYKTVLVYSHYDVMPAEPLELWNSEPFELTIKDDRMWARGANDDKGQAFIQAKAFEAMVQSGELKCNVKFLFEGEEEVGSPSLEAFCVEHKELLQADVILVSDTGMISENDPSITTGLRGLAYWQIDVKGPSHDLHSGIFGGAVANPINELCKMIAEVTDENGKITIPGFYDDVEIVSQEERDLMAQAPHSDQEYMNALKLNGLFGESGYSTLERTWIRPTFDVCGIWGGYQGDGSKTVLPSEAHAKLSCRLVPGQDHEKIGELVKQYFEAKAPAWVKVNVTSMHGGESYVCPITLPAYKAAEKAYHTTFGKRPLPTRSGGSIPIIAAFERVLGMKSLLMGFGLESDAIHSPNENFRLPIFYKGIETVCEFYKEFAKI
ncbi:MAG: dipeptidase [Bacteroidales bacterium]